MEEELLECVKEYLIEKYNCHSIILYGSFANGDYTDESDIDVVCFSDNHNKENDTTTLNNRQLDVWIYNTQVMSDTTQFLHTRDGKVLLDEKNRCIDFLNNIDKEFARGPKQLTIKEKIFLRIGFKRCLEGQKREIWKGIFDIIGCLQMH